MNVATNPPAVENILSELLTEPLPGLLRARVTLEAHGADTQSWSVSVDRHTGKWELDLDDGDFHSQWDPETRTLHGPADGPIQMEKSLWSMPAPHPVRMLVPRFWPIWGRERASDQYRLIQVDSADKHTQTLTFARLGTEAPLITPRATFVPSRQFFTTFEYWDGHWTAELIR